MAIFPNGNWRWEAGDLHSENARIHDRDTLIDTVDVISLDHPTFSETMKSILGPK